MTSSAIGDPGHGALAPSVRAAARGSPDLLEVIVALLVRTIIAILRASDQSILSRIKLVWTLVLALVVGRLLMLRSWLLKEDDDRGRGPRGPRRSSRR